MIEDVVGVGKQEKESRRADSKAETIEIQNKDRGCGLFGYWWSV